MFGATVVAVAASGQSVGVVCDDRAVVRRMVAALLVRSGFEPVEVDLLGDLRRAIHHHAPAVAVVGLPMLGMTGLGVLPSLLAPCPRLQVVLLSGFETLRPVALEAGAAALVADDDPVQLRQHLLRIAASTVGVPAARSSAGVSPGTGRVSTKPSS